MVESKVFDWVEESKNHDSFLSWMFINLLTPVDHVQQERIAEKTDKYSKVELTIQINGEPVNADYFVESIERNMHYFAEARAKEMIGELSKLDALHDLTNTLTGAVRSAVDEATKGSVLENWRDDDRW